jgi:hypothetical protein
MKEKGAGVLSVGEELSINRTLAHLRLTNPGAAMGLGQMLNRDAS